MEKKKIPLKRGGRFQYMSDSTILTLITAAVFVLLYLFAILYFRKGFLKPQTFFDILNANAALIILSCGMTVVMISGGIDISVGGVSALISMCCAVYLDYNGGSFAGALLIALGIGLVFGAVQGFLVAYLDIQPFIITLAGMFFARGMTTLIHSDPFTVKNEEFVRIRETRITVPFLGSYNKHGVYINAYIETGVIVALIIAVVLFFMLKKTRSGRDLYAVGGNRQSALMLGINVKRTVFLSHLICGVLAGIGGFVYFMHVGSGSAVNAEGAEMNAIASSIIGGTTLSGGEGNIIGTVLGAVTLALMQNIVSSAGLDEAWWTGITIAVMLCAFLVLQSVLIALRKKGTRK